MYVIVIVIFFDLIHQLSISILFIEILVSNCHTYIIWFYSTISMSEIWCSGWWFGTVFIFHILGISIPTDELIFFGGVGIPPTSYIWWFYSGFWAYPPWRCCYEWGRWKTKATNHHGQASAWEPMESARTSIGSLGDMRAHHWPRLLMFSHDLHIEKWECIGI
jgi:hypothetical protein